MLTGVTRQISHQRILATQPPVDAAGLHRGLLMVGRSFSCPSGQVPVVKTKSSSRISTERISVSSPMWVQMAARERDSLGDDVRLRMTRRDRISSTRGRFDQ